MPHGLFRSVGTVIVQNNRDQVIFGSVSLAGEDLAALVGLYYPEISNIDGTGPYFEPRKIVPCGCRDNDEHLLEVSEKLRLVIPASNAIADGVIESGKRIESALIESGARPIGFILILMFWIPV